MIIAVMSGKGGVGKSSVSVLLAKALSEKHRTLLLDFDICGPSITTAFGATGGLTKTSTGFKPIQLSENLDGLSFGSVLQPTDAVIWRGPKKRVFLDLFFKSAKEYDWVVIDTPPGVSEEHSFLIGQNVYALVVTTPQNMALSDAQRCIEFCLDSNIPVLGVLENMAFFKCEKCSVLHRPFGSKGGSLLAQEYGLNYLGELGIETSLTDALDNGQINEYFRSLNTYEAIIQIIGKMGLNE